MPIRDVVENIKNNVQNAYAALEEQGADIPENKNIENLSATVRSISAGSDSGGKYLVQVFDYDGTIIKQDHLNTGAVFTLPQAPVHDRLVFQEWSCSIDVNNNSITVGNSDIIVGAVYTTTSGLSEFDISLNARTGLKVILRMDGVKNWGDGTSDELTSHTYTNYGDYTITCSGTSINTSSSSLGIFDRKGVCSEIRLANVSSITTHAFECNTLERISLPNTVTYIGYQSFQDCKSLRHLTIPPRVTTFSDYAFGTCYNMSNIVLPKSLVSFSDGHNGGHSIFQYCYSLEKIIIPEGITYIGRYEFKDCYRLKHIKFPKNISQFGEYALHNTYALRVCDFSDFEFIPTISSSSIFGSNNFLRIIVPDSLYDEWIAATNWTSYAANIIKVSEV